MADRARLYAVPDRTVPDMPSRQRGDQAREPLWREALGRRLRVLRQENGEKLTETAGRAGISPQYLSEVERGRKEPSSEMIAALAGALGTTLIDLTEQVAEDLRRWQALAAPQQVSAPGQISAPRQVVAPRRPGPTRQVDRSRQVVRSEQVDPTRQVDRSEQAGVSRQFAAPQACAGLLSLAA